MKQKTLSAREARKIVHELLLLGIPCRIDEGKRSRKVFAEFQMPHTEENICKVEVFNSLDRFISYCHANGLQLSKEVLR